MREDYKVHISNFQNNFIILYTHFNLSMTLKVHVIFSHYEDYFQLTGKTFKFTSGEYVETAHRKLRISEEAHALKIKRKIASDMHLKKALQSHILWNSKHSGALLLVS